MTQWAVTFRQLWRRPAFGIVAVLLLALGVGINTTVFAVVETVLLKPLPYPDASQLVSILEANPSKHQAESLIAPARLEDWNRLSSSFTAISGAYSENVTDTSGNVPERLAALRVAPRYFDVYRAKPLAGRIFNKQEEVYGGPSAVVISAAFWKRRFSDNPAALGARLIFSRQGYTIIGVLPRTFGSPETDAWLPASINPFLAKMRDARFPSGIGRMKPGVSVRQAQADLDRVQRHLGEEFPQTDRGWSSVVESKKQQMVGDHGKTIWIAFAGTSLLLILSCVNIASLLIGRIYQRERELALRASLGATSWQVAGVILREIGVIAVAGCCLGVLLSYESIEFIAKALADLPRMTELALDGDSVLFAAALGMIFLLLVGLLPVLQNSPTRLSEVLAQSGRTPEAARHPIQRYLLIGQFALTVILLCSAGLLLRTYYHLSEVQTGFDAKNVVTFHVGAEWSEDRNAIGATQQRILSELTRAPGVEWAGMTNFLPTDAASLRFQYQLEDVSNESGSRSYVAGSRTVTDGYLAALRIPVLQGKSCPELEPNSTWSKDARALVNQAFVDQFLGGVAPIGKHVVTLGTDLHIAPEIVGVVGNVREDGASIGPSPYVYNCAVAGGWPDPEYVVRTKEDARGARASIRQIVQRAAPNRTIFGLQTMEDHVASALGQPRLTARMLTAFAMTALGLAAFGLYSLTMLTVTAQTREIGTRMALGAYTGQVIREVFVRAARLMGAGVVIGIAGAVGAGHLLRSFLFGVSPEDPMTLVGVVVLLLLVCFLATLLPALRAAAIDPIEALRSE